MNNSEASPSENRPFPKTRHSVIAVLKSASEPERRQALATVVESYWKPAYKYLRLKWNKDKEAAEDLIQEFFLSELEKNFLSGFDPARARFRTFLRTCLDRLVQNQNRAAGRIKRGGNAEVVAFDFAVAEAEIQAPASNHNPEDFFEREWIRGLMELSVENLKKHCGEVDKETAFKLFEKYDLAGLETEEKTSYARLAVEFQINEETVTNQLAYARREFRRIVLEKLRELTASEEEFREEARTVLGMDVK